MQYPLLMLAALVLGAFAGWLYGRIGFELLAQEERARGDKSLKAPGLARYFTGWVLPLLIGFAGFILGFIGHSGVPQAGQESQTPALANPGLVYVLIAQVVGLGLGRMGAKS